MHTPHHLHACALAAHRRSSGDSVHVIDHGTAQRLLLSLAGDPNKTGALKMDASRPSFAHIRASACTWPPATTQFAAEKVLSK